MKGFKIRNTGTKDTSIRKESHGNPDKLVLVHISSAGFLREILRSGQLNPRRCAVFQHGLVYFFVLRPAYKLKGSDEKHDLLDFFPVALLFDIERLSPPYHVYPLDTGGAASGAFHDASNPSLFLDDLELDSTFEAAAGHIDWAFASRLDYFEGRLKPDLHSEFASWESGPATFLKIARLAQVGHNRPDSRASAVEIAFDFPIPLVPHARHVVIPKQFLEDVRGKNFEMIDRLNEMKIRYSTYDWHANSAPSDFHFQIKNKVKSYLVGRSFL